METFSKKREYRFIIVSTKHHFHTKLPYKKPMLRQTEWWVQKWTYHKERSFACHYFVFLKVLFQFKNLRTSYKESLCCTNYSQAHIFVSTGVLFDGALFDTVRAVDTGAP